MTQNRFEENHLRPEELDSLIKKDAKNELSSDELLTISEADTEAILAARNARKSAKSHGGL